MTRAVHDPPAYGELLLRGLTRSPSTPALEFGGQVVSRSEALSRVRQASRWLARMVPDPAGGVAAVASNRPELFYLWAGAAVAGRRFTALHPYSSAGDHLEVLRDADPALVVADDDAIARLGPVLEDGSFLVRSLDDMVEMEAESAEPVTVDTLPDTIISLAYTGGSTGTPKGVVRSDRTMSAATLGVLADWEWPATPRLLVVNPMTHGSSIMLAPTLLLGGTIVIEPGFDATTFPSIVARTRATITFLVPTMIARLLSALPDGAAGGLTSLETVVYGGAPMPEAVRRQAVTALGPILMQIYGQVEAPMQIAVLDRAAHIDASVPSGAVGRPVSSAIVTIRDPEGRTVPAGERGEICVQGPVVMDGYWRRPEATATALRHGALWTGDLGRLDADGWLHIVGRSKEMIISGGVNVFTAEVEAALSSHPDVAEAAAWGVPDEEWGERLVAAVVARDGRVLAVDEVRSHVRGQKGPIQTPKELLVLDRLPTTAVGKVDKIELGRMLCDGERRGTEMSATKEGHS